VRAVWAVERVPGSFAALRMTAKTYNGKNNSKGPTSQREMWGLSVAAWGGDYLAVVPMSVAWFGIFDETQPGGGSRLRQVARVKSRCGFHKERPAGTPGAPKREFKRQARPLR